MSKLISAVDLALDTAYQQITDAEWQQLFELAEARGVFEKRNAIFSGSAVNQSEGRSVLHPALRNLSDQPMMVDGQDVMPQVKAVWQRMEGFCNQLIGITDVICIGIGGSDWGPRLVCDALYQVNPNVGKAIRLHFVANVDSAELATTLAKAQPRSTRVLITSKTFTTLETMRNAETVINWLKSHQVASSQIQKLLKPLVLPQRIFTHFGIGSVVVSQYGQQLASQLPSNSALPPTNNS